VTIEERNQTEETHEKQPTSIRDLKPHMKLRGKVTRVGLSGAFVDIGLNQEGWVHISQLSQHPVNRVSEIVEEDQEVTVWVKRVDRTRKRISLTMIEPPERTLRDLTPGMIIGGKVTRLTPFGAFVDIGVGCDGLVHISELAPGYVNDPAEIVSVGDEVEVKVLNVDRRRRQIELSIKDIPIDDDIDEEEPIPTMMELAFQEAFGRQEGEGDSKERKAKGGKERPPRGKQNDIINRTLRNHRG
jgi:transcriptional accessory protein Tex/SPT6